MAGIQSLKNIFKSSAALATAAPLTALAAPVGTGLALGSLQFGAPLALAGLAALPALWWLMRSIPPKPTVVDFPAVNILFTLKTEDQQPAKMPWWQYLLRTAAVAAVVIGLAQPEWNPVTPLDGDGPVMLVVDNGWASGRNWALRVSELNALVDRAEREKRPLIILPTAPSDDGSGITPSGPMSAEEARGVLKELKPQPGPVDRQAALNAAQSLPSDKQASVVWLSDGLADAGALPLANHLQKRGNLTVMQDSPDFTPRLLAPPDGTVDTLTVTLKRLNGAKAETVSLSAGDDSGHAISQMEAHFKAGETEAKVTFDVPAEIRNQLVRVTIDGDNSAGSIVLLDERWRRRPVAVIANNASESGLMLLNEASYIEQALGPYVDLHIGDAENALKEKMAVIVMGDSAALSGAAQARIDSWTRDGGTLLRFAGPNMAAQNKTKDTLLPLELRPGSRAVGGGLSESKPGRIAPFEKDSPFYGIKIPENITIDRQVLARPDAVTDAQIWASLEDGSPLVTAKPHGKGWIVLVHTTANREWSNLALSGLFIDMLRAVVVHSQGVEKGPDGASVALPPLKVLDGYGQFRTPSPAVRPLTKDVMQSGQVGPKNPPGFYGNESIRQAHNLAGAVPELKPLPPMPAGTVQRTYDSGKGPADLSGWLLGGAMSLMLLDLLVLLGQRGALSRSSGGKTPPREKPAALDKGLHM